MAVERAGDVQCRRQIAGAARQVLLAHAGTVAGHEGDAFERLECPQQHAGADVGTAGADVQGEPAAVDEVDVGMAAFKEQRGISRGLALVGVPARIAHDIGLGFDDASAHATPPVLAHQGLADQPARQDGSRHGQFGAR